MRCVALAQAWRRAGGDVTFLMREGLAAIEERIRAEGVLLQTLPGEGGGSAEDFVRPAIDAGCPIAVLDGYSFGASEQATLSGAGIRVLTIDDYGHASDYPVRWVLNQNAYATPEMYGRTNHNSKLLLGQPMRCCAMNSRRGSGGSERFRIGPARFSSRLAEAIRTTQANKFFRAWLC